MREAKEIAVEQARTIQFTEYERRLSGLNHAHEQAVAAQAATVPRETFENYSKETRLANELALKNVEIAGDKRSGEVDRRLAILESFRDRTTGATDLSKFGLERIMALAAIAIAVASILTR